MNATKHSLLAAAVAGLFLGTSCGGGEETGTGGKDPEAGAPAGQQTPVAAIEKHACKGLNTCSGKGGCKTEKNECKGKNSCKEQGGCATVAHHTCKGQNTCKELGGCGSGDNGCRAKNSCKGKGGCAVPIKH